MLNYTTAPGGWARGGRQRLAVLLILASCCGCLKADVFYFFSPDSADDSFTVTALYLNIAAENPADRDHLADLWKERAEIITNPFEINFFGGQAAIKRLDANRYQRIDLASPAKEPLPISASEIPLDAIKIMPGKFFLSADNRLGYYHQFTVPGKTVDQIITLSNRAIGELLIREIPLELKRRTDGGKTPTWDDARREIAAPHDADKKPAAPGQAGNAAASPAHGGQQQADKSGLPLDDNSLRVIQKAAESGSLAVQRRGAEISVAVPLSANDCREAKQTFDLAVKTYTEQHKPKPAAETGIPELITMIRAENDHDQRLVVSLDLSRLARLDGGDNALHDPNLVPHYRETIDFLRAHQIPIDEKLSLKEVLDMLEGK